MEEPIYSYWKVLKRVLRYIQVTESLGLFYSNAENYKLVGYSDSDWCGDIDDRKSTWGYVFSTRRNPKGISRLERKVDHFGADSKHSIYLAFKEQLIVTLSTCEAEYVLASWCICHAIWLRNLLSKMEPKKLGATVIQVDNKSTIELTKNPVNHERNKHITVHFHLIRDHVKERSVELLHVASDGYFYKTATKSTFQQI